MTPQPTDPLATKTGMTPQPTDVHATRTGMPPQPTDAHATHTGMLPSALQFLIYNALKVKPICKKFFNISNLISYII